MKVTEAPKRDEKSGEMKGTSGAISLYGMGRFPDHVPMAAQWERLIDNAAADPKPSSRLNNAAHSCSVKEAK